MGRWWYSWQLYRPFQVRHITHRGLWCVHDYRTLVKIKILEYWSVGPEFTLDFIAFKLRYAIHVPITVMATPAKVIAREVMVSKEVIIVPFEFQEPRFDLWFRKDTSLCFSPLVG
jgi:hypothetical protein